MSGQGFARMGMAETEADIVSDLRDLADGMAQYSYLIECARECAAFDEDLHVEDNLVRDCAVNTWIKVERREGRTVLVGDSESMIVRGAIALIAEIYDDRSACELAGYECHLLDEDLFARHFSPKQREGLRHAIKRVERLMADVAKDDARPL